MQGRNTSSKQSHSVLDSFYHFDFLSIGWVKQFIYQLGHWYEIAQNYVTDTPIIYSPEPVLPESVKHVLWMRENYSKLIKIIRKGLKHKEFNADWVKQLRNYFVLVKKGRFSFLAYIEGLKDLMEIDNQLPRPLNEWITFVENEISRLEQNGNWALRHFHLSIYDGLLEVINNNITPLYWLEMLDHFKQMVPQKLHNSVLQQLTCFSQTVLMNTKRYPYGIYAVPISTYRKLFTEIECNFGVTQLDSKIKDERRSKHKYKFKEHNKNAIKLHLMHESNNKQNFFGYSVNKTNIMNTMLAAFIINLTLSETFRNFNGINSDWQESNGLVNFSADFSVLSYISSIGIPLLLNHHSMTQWAVFVSLANNFLYANADTSTPQGCKIYRMSNETNFINQISLNYGFIFKNPASFEIRMRDISNYSLGVKGVGESISYKHRKIANSHSIFDFTIDTLDDVGNEIPKLSEGNYIITLYNNEKKKLFGIYGVLQYDCKTEKQISNENHSNREQTSEYIDRSAQNENSYSTLLATLSFGGLAVIILYYSFKCLNQKPHNKTARVKNEIPPSKEEESIDKEDLTTEISFEEVNYLEKLTEKIGIQPLGPVDYLGKIKSNDIKKYIAKDISLYKQLVGNVPRLYNNFPTKKISYYVKHRDGRIPNQLFTPINDQHKNEDAAILTDENKNINNNNVLLKKDTENDSDNNNQSVNTSPRITVEDEDRIIFYIPGTACSVDNPLIESSIASHLSNAFKSKVILIHHTLAPHNQWPAQLNDVCYTISAYLKKHSQCHIILAGYSTGGLLATLAAIIMQDMQVDSNFKITIHKLILFAPALDMSGEFRDLGVDTFIKCNDYLPKNYKNKYKSIKKLQKKAKNDKVFNNDGNKPFVQMISESFSKEHMDPLTNLRRYSPVWFKNACFEPKYFPKTKIIVGENDYFRVDIEIFFEKLQDAGCNAVKIVVPGYDHSLMWKTIYPVYLAQEKKINDLNDLYEKMQKIDKDYALNKSYFASDTIQKYSKTVKNLCGIFNKFSFFKTNLANNKETSDKVFEFTYTKNIKIISQ